MGDCKHEYCYRHELYKYWRRLLIIFIVISIIVLLVVLYVILFKPKDPEVEVQSIQLSSINVQGFVETSATVSVSLNLVIKLDNPNRATFHVEDARSTLCFYGDILGAASVPPGDVGDRSSVLFTVCLSTQSTSSSIGGPYVNADIAAGILSLSTSTTIRGRVTMLNIIHHHAVTQANCIVGISLRSSQIIGYTCKNSISL